MNGIAKWSGRLRRWFGKPLQDASGIARGGVALALAMAVACALAGCAGEADRGASTGQQSVSDVLQQQAGAADGRDTATDDGPETADDGFVGDRGPAFAQVDIDLPAMNSDMVYATVYDMLESPSSYEGKIVKMAGTYYHTYYEPTGNDYFYVVVKDATACCSQGIEFVWGDGRHAYPGDYPEDGREVVVTGRFEPYMEGAERYVHLVDSSLEAA